MTGMVGLPVRMMAFEDLPIRSIGSVMPTYTKALSPVMARPTIRVFISRVPSYE